MRKFWSSEEIEILKKYYPDNLTSELLEMLPERTVITIAGKASGIGIKKSDAFMKSPKSGRISKENDIGIDTRYSKNCPGWNKGKKQVDYMSAENIEKTKATRFKKGQDPHNTVPIGFERVSKDGYIEIKIQHLKDGKSNNKNFEFKHRIIYENNFGKIPKGMIVEFFDGNKLNFEPSNLVLRTRKENLLQNTMCDTSIVKRFLKIKEPEMVEKVVQDMPKLIELKRKMLNLKTKINERNAIK